VGVTRVTYAAEGWGLGEVWFDDRARVLQHDLPRVREYPHPGWGSDPPPALRSTLARIHAPNGVGIAPSLERLVHRLAAYFAGAEDDFADVELDLDWCTPFQRAVADALRAVRRGEVVTYGELAALAGYPNAQRAAGTFCAHNRFGLVVPCHRVVAAGGIGSYGSAGVAYKRRLLELEGVGEDAIRSFGGIGAAPKRHASSAKLDA
jgi:methylated-DNA-[protein]-cysteine S-methyltransferase